MPCGIAFCLLFEVLFQRLGKVNASLVGQAEQHPQHVGHLVCRVGRFARLEALVAVLAGDDARQLANFLREE